MRGDWNGARVRQRFFVARRRCATRGACCCRWRHGWRYPRRCGLEACSCESFHPSHPPDLSLTLVWTKLDAKLHHVLFQLCPHQTGDSHPVCVCVCVCQGKNEYDVQRMIYGAQGSAVTLELVACDRGVSHHVTVLRLFDYRSAFGPPPPPPDVCQPF
jgi:hypothetical protein